MRPGPILAAGFVALVFILALAFATPAAAQVTFPLPPCEARPPLPVPAASAPAGLPMQWGGSCTAAVEANTVGAAAALFCPRPVGPAAAYLYAVRWSAVTPAMAADFAMLGLPGGDGRERVRAFQAKYQTANVWDMCDVWGPARERFNAAMPPPKPPAPPAPSWVTASTSAYSLRSGGLGPLAGSASLGAACDCGKALQVGTASYCPFAGGGALVARCKRP